MRSLLLAAALLSTCALMPAAEGKVVVTGLKLEPEGDLQVGVPARLTATLDVSCLSAPTHHVALAWSADKPGLLFQGPAGLDIPSQACLAGGAFTAAYNVTATGEAPGETAIMLQLTASDADGETTGRREAQVMFHGGLQGVQSSQSSPVGASTGLAAVGLALSLGRLSRRR
jgi:hypothetical protein